MIRTFTIETDQADCDGTVIDLKGIEIPERVIVSHNFHHSIDQIIGYGRVWVENSVLKCEADISDKWLDCWPAIGFTMDKYTVTSSGKLITQARLHCVGLCDKPNLNPDIKTIREQLQTKSPL